MQIKGESLLKPVQACMNEQHELNLLSGVQCNVGDSRNPLIEVGNDREHGSNLDCVPSVANVRNLYPCLHPPQRPSHKETWTRHPFAMLNPGPQKYYLASSPDLV
jgi:hypothetical protein